MKKLFATLACSLVLTACGGRGASITPPVSSTVSGTASQGAPIAGLVTLKDSKGASKTGSIDTTTGAFSIVVDGMSAPFILKAGNYYSVANSATTTNINPLTDLCAKTAAGSSSIDTVFSNPTIQLSTLATIATKLPGIVADLRTSLDDLYPSSVPLSKRDFMHGALTIDQGVDFVLKNISISSASGNMTINYNLQVLVSVTVVNNVATVTPNSSIITTMANDIQTAIGAASTSTPALTSATFSGKSFSTSDGIITFNTDGTLSGAGANLHGSQTWTVNSSGQLVVTNTGKGTSTYTLISGNATNGWTGTSTYSDGSPSTTVTLVLITTDTTFSTSDLAGAWNVFQFVIGSGLPGSNSYWSKDTYSFDANGLATISNGVKSNGNTGYSGSMQLAISSEGAITSPQSSTVLYMSTNKQFFVGTGGTGGDESLYFAVKTGSGFTSADLVGNWKANGLTQGTTTSWIRSDIAIDASGNMVSTNPVSSTGEIIESSTSKISISNQGVVTNPNNSSNYGVMDSSKNNIFVVGKDSSGNLQLMIFTRTGGTTFTLADMQGSWRFNLLSLQNYYWGRGVTTFDTLGNCAYTGYAQSNTGAQADATQSFTTMTSGGIFGNSYLNTTFSGVMALNKKLMIATVTQDISGNPSPTLMVWVK